MKSNVLYLLSLFFSVILISGCQHSGVNDLNNASDEQFAQERAFPKVPQANILEASSDDPSNSEPQKEVKPKTPNLNDVAFITKEELIQGYYFGKKKVGTPASWVQVQKDGQLTWMSELLAERQDQDRVAQMCESTGGHYRFSCSETDREDCSHGPSECVCPDNTKDYPGDEGCLLYDEENKKFPLITEEEKERGFYPGFKKLGTLENWIYFPGEENPKSIKDEFGWRAPYLK